MGKTRSILLVEDDVDVSEMLSHYLQVQGYEVLTTFWGEDAIRIAEEKPPDLTVLDIRLPGIDGFEVCRQLRSQQRTKHVPIIFLTECEQRSDRLSGLRLGAVDYITKPFDFQELRLRVRNVLRRTDLHVATNPITDLATGAVIDDQLVLLLWQEKWTLLLIQVRGLHEFNDHYGFMAGDEMLRAIALLLKDIAEEQAAFIGHLGECDFVFINSARQDEQSQRQIAARLEQALDSLRLFQSCKWRANGQPGLSLSVNSISAQDGPWQISLGAMPNRANGSSASRPAGV